MQNSGPSRGRNASIVAVALGVGLLGAASDAHAAFMLRLSSSAGGLPIVVTDNGAGDTNPAADAIVTTQGVNGYSLVNITVGVTNTPGSASGATLQVTNFARRDATLGSPVLTIQLAANNYTTPGTPPLTLNSSGGGTIASNTGAESVTFESYADPSNVLWSTGTGTPIQSFSTIGAGAPIGYAFPDQSVPFAGGTPYQLYNVTKVTLTSPNAENNFSGTTTVVPEPAAFGVLGLAGLGLLRRRRKA